MLAIWIRRLFLPVGTYFGDSLPELAYGWCAYTSNVFIPNRFAEARKVSGSTDGRFDFGASLPFGPVTPQATCSPWRYPLAGEITTECTPV